LDELTALDVSIDSYVAHLSVERNLAKNTLESYGRDLRDFTDAMIERGITEPAAVRAESIADWVRDLARAGLKARSQARMLVAVRGFFRHLKATRVLTEDPSKLIDLPRAGRTLPELVAHDEVMKLASVADSSRDRALVMLLYGAGLRVSEVVRLELSAVALDAGMIRVRGKGGKERVVPIGTPVIDSLERYLRDRAVLLAGRTNDLVFPGRRPERPLTRQAAFEVLRRLAAKADIGRDISPHKLRHGFATDLVRGGADLRSVQMMLGHADLRTTEVYTHVDDEHLRKTYDLTHPRR
jgi:integrase/recombinase XerD